MPIQAITFVARNARVSSTGRSLGLFAVACIAVVLTACAPVQQGNDQSKDFNVNLVELKDAKYKTLPVAARNPKKWPSNIIRTDRRLTGAMERLLRLTGAESGNRFSAGHPTHP